MNDGNMYDLKKGSIMAYSDTFIMLSLSGDNSNYNGVWRREGLRGSARQTNTTGI
jgi:hypothetical protein